MTKWKATAKKRKVVGKKRIKGRAKATKKK